MLYQTFEMCPLSTVIHCSVVTYSAEQLVTVVYDQEDSQQQPVHYYKLLAPWLYLVTDSSGGEDDAHSPPFSTETVY